MEMSNLREASLHSDCTSTCTSCRYYNVSKAWSCLQSAGTLISILSYLRLALVRLPCTTTWRCCAKTTKRKYVHSTRSVGAMLYQQDGTHEGARTTYSTMVDAGDGPSGLIHILILLT